MSHAPRTEPTMTSFSGSHSFQELTIMVTLSVVSFGSFSDDCWISSHICPCHSRPSGLVRGQVVGKSYKIELHMNERSDKAQSLLQPKSPFEPRIRYSSSARAPSW